MTRLINIDNGGTLTDFCPIDGGEVRYTKTLTTPYDLSRCLFDGLAKVSERASGEPQLATRAVHRLHPVFHHPGHQRSHAAGRTAAAPAGRRSDAGRLAATQAQEDLRTVLVGDPWGPISLDTDEEALSRELFARVNDLSARGAGAGSSQ
jgi:hypothetical protein